MWSKLQNRESNAVQCMEIKKERGREKLEEIYKGQRVVLEDEAMSLAADEDYQLMIVHMRLTVQNKCVL